MNHQDHVRLIERGIAAGGGGVWADLGSGEGAFTLALRDIAGPEVEIFSIDRDRSRLRTQQQALARHFPVSRVRFIEADFTRPLDLPPLDGILAANAIHFVRDKPPLFRQLHRLLKDDGRLIVVEYNVDAGNHWVPFPFSFRTFTALATAAGFRAPALLATYPSRVLGEMYAAAAAPAPAMTVSPAADTADGP